MPQTVMGLVVTAVLSLTGAARAQCVGQNLIETLPPDTRAAIEARADAVPYPLGNYWRATRDGQSVTLLGTFHLDDPRHDTIIAAVRPALEAAATLLVEAGPLEEKALLDQIARDPSAVLLPDNGTLVEQLPPEDWDKLAAALEARRVPAFMGSRFQPWYVSMLLAIPPCAMQAAQGRNGLDRRLIDLAETQDIPVKALEPHDTALTLFQNTPPELQFGLIRSSLAMEDRAADQFATMTAVYFDERPRLLWEYSRHVTLAMPGADPETVEAELAATEEALLSRRNRAWIPVIEAAAAEAPVFAGFGALHLPGKGGVLNLLVQNGWTVERLDLPETDLPETDLPDAADPPATDNAPAP